MALSPDFTTSVVYLVCATESEDCTFEGKVEGLDKAATVRVTCPECGWEHHI